MAKVIRELRTLISIVCRVIKQNNGVRMRRGRTQLMMEELTIDVDSDFVEEESEEIPPEYTITSYGADYPVDGLVKRITAGSIVIPPFQRDFVWTMKQSSRFIESLLLGLPVPGIFLSRESESQILLVIDGQQRLRTLQFFYDGVFAPLQREFSLVGLESRFKGATYRTLPDEDRRKLDDSILHATIVRQDEPSDDDSSIYNIFERLNTGGTLLAPQQIRASIYHGPFNDLLASLNANPSWRQIFGADNKFMRDQELILRFFALYYDLSSYKQPMKGFLNSYMKHNGRLKFQPAEELVRTFSSTIEAVRRYIGSKAFRPERALNAAVFDAVMIGLARRMEAGPITDGDAIALHYSELLTDEDFISATDKATSDEDRVGRRVRLATRAFADVE